MASAPDTVVLIHGLWMTPRSWEHWVTHYRKRGMQVLAPAYPGLEVEVEALRADPTPIEKLTVEGVVFHLETVIRKLPQPPILIGHSMGGGLVQILLDRGLGAAGVAINSVPVKGILLPLATVRATLPIVANPANYNRAVGFTFEQFHRYFATKQPVDEVRKAYDRYHIPAPGRFVFQGALANFNPHAANRVDFDREDRAPLLFIGGTEDQLMPASLNRSNARHYNSGIVAYEEFEGRDHYTIGAPGWEKVADRALDWALHPSVTGASRAGPAGG